jgi:hypothetical protein
MKKILAAVMIVFALAACTPGLDGDNPVPEPNPDHGPKATTAVYLWCLMQDRLDQPYRGHVNGAISYLDIARKPLVVINRETGAEAASLPFKCTGPFGGIEIGFDNPLAEIAIVTAVFSGAGGSSCNFEFTRDRAGNQSYHGYNAVPGDIVEIPLDQDEGARTVNFEVIRPTA